MSDIAKISTLVEEGANLRRKHSDSNSEQYNKKAKLDKNMSRTNEKVSNFSLINFTPNGTIKLSAPLCKSGATTKKLVIKNFKSMFTYFCILET